MTWEWLQSCLIDRLIIELARLCIWCAVSGFCSHDFGSENSLVNLRWGRQPSHRNPLSEWRDAPLGLGAHIMVLYEFFFGGQDSKQIHILKQRWKMCVSLMVGEIYPERLVILCVCVLVCGPLLLLVTGGRLSLECWVPEFDPQRYDDFIDPTLSAWVARQMPGLYCCASCMLQRTCGWILLLRKCPRALHPWLFDMYILCLDRPPTQRQQNWYLTSDCDFSCS